MYWFFWSPEVRYNEVILYVFLIFHVFCVRWCLLLVDCRHLLCIF